MWPVGYERRVLEQVDSTLTEAARLASETAAPVWIMAHHQTQARGRRGRAWSMPKGNFAATLLLPVSESPETVALRSFVASLALREALLEAGAMEHQVALKWPNDVLLNGGKVAGILLESAGGLDKVFIGIGVNLVAAPGQDQVEEGAVRPVSLKGEARVTVAPEDFLTMLARSYADWEERFQTYGFAPIREAWLRNAARLGEVVTARTVREEYLGTFRDVDLAGQLVLDTAKGPLTIPAADVYF
ncbi:MAG: biotin--[acetyl-CoA-carboxylase] ligase [Rhodobacteraceae bacterium]|nr:biotin--[acetyl-CoA-carboxylase] ligase [Paracoccaceae bacterium]